MKSKVAELLERYGYRQDGEPMEYNVRYWRSDRYGLPVSLINGIWECCDDVKVQRGTGSKTGLDGWNLRSCARRGANYLAIDESKLTPSEQVQLGIFKAMAGNQMDGEIAFAYSRSPFGNWAPRPKPVPVQSAAPAPVEKTPSGPQPGEPGYSEYYGLVHYPEWTPALQASVEALPNDYVSEQGHSKLDLLQFLKLYKERTIQDAVDSERINREYEQRQGGRSRGREKAQFWLPVLAPSLEHHLFRLYPRALPRILRCLAHIMPVGQARSWRAGWSRERRPLWLLQTGKVRFADNTRTWSAFPATRSFVPMA